MLPFLRAQNVLSNMNTDFGARVDQVGFMKKKKMEEVKSKFSRRKKKVHMFHSREEESHKQINVFPTEGQQENQLQSITLKHYG